MDITDKINIPYHQRILKSQLFIYSSIGFLVFVIMNLIYLFLTKSYFFIYFNLLILLPLVAILMISKKRAIFYLTNFSMDSSKIIFEYYEKDNFKTCSILWKDIGFYYKSMKNEGVFSIYQSNDKLMTFYLKMANHEKLLRELYDTFFQYFPKEEIIVLKQISPFYSNIALDTAYTKSLAKQIINQ
jgi:hypothetical protein